MSSPVTSLAIETVNAGGLTGRAQITDYTLSDIADLYRAGVLNIQNILHGGPTSEPIPPPDLSSNATYQTITLPNGTTQDLTALQVLQNVINSLRNLFVTGRTVPVDPNNPNGLQKTYYMTSDMAEQLDILFRVLQMVGVNVNTPGTVSINLDQAKALQNISALGLILDPLFAFALNEIRPETNRSFQAMVELDFVKAGNDMLSDQLSSLENALGVTKDVLDELANLQREHNKLSVSDRAAFATFFNQTNPAPFTTLSAYLAAYDAAVNSYFGNPLSPGANFPFSAPANTDFIANVPANSTVWPIGFGQSFNDYLGTMNATQTPTYIAKRLGPGNRYNIYSYSDYFTRFLNGLPPVSSSLTSVLIGQYIPPAGLFPEQFFDIVNNSSDTVLLFADPNASIPNQYTSGGAYPGIYNSADRVALQGTDGSITAFLTNSTMKLIINTENASLTNARADFFLNDQIQAKKIPSLTNVTPRLMGFFGTTPAQFEAFNYFTAGFPNPRLLQLIGYGGGYSVLPSDGGSYWVDLNNLQATNASQALNFLNELSRIRAALDAKIPLLNEITPRINKTAANPAGDEDPNTLLARLRKVVAGIPVATGNVAVDLVEARKWLLDNYDLRNTPGSVQAGAIQQDITFAVTAGQSLNDRQKESVRRFLFIFEEYYKAASAVLQKLTQFIEKMAQGIAR